MACPKVALEVAVTVSRNRITSALSAVLLAQSSDRPIGDWAPAAVIAAGPLVTFRPGGVNDSSSNSSGNGNGNGNGSSWYNQQLVYTMTPWLTVAARSMWLIGQLLSELLPASSSSSSGSSSSSSSSSGTVSVHREQQHMDAPAIPPTDINHVDELKALLAALGVPGVAGAVEKADLVALLVGHLGLS
ncbi:hypothetical protein OEZ86_007495 [Tetradesmus obliquus]|nr:hypothetical protein OEZ86_007495 [Tetradesmus obliquus]